MMSWIRAAWSSAGLLASRKLRLLGGRGVLKGCGGTASEEALEDGGVSGSRGVVGDGSVAGDGVMRA